MAAHPAAVPTSQQVHGPRIEDRILREAPPQAWRRLSTGSGARGERSYDWAAARLPAVWEFDGDEPTRQRWMPARRSITRPDEIACCPASAPLDATVADPVRVAGRRWKAEECFPAASSECGPDRYEVRRYVGWYRHLPPALLAPAVLAAMAARESEKRGAPMPARPTSRTSHRPRSVVCRQLPPAAGRHAASTP